MANERVSPFVGTDSPITCVKLCMIEEGDFARHERKEPRFFPVVDVDSYLGRSERIKGFQRVRKAIGGMQGISSVSPLILAEEWYQEYSNHGLSSELKDSVQLVWDSLDGNQHPLIVRRLFPDSNGEAKTGPRSGNVTSSNDLLAEVDKFFTFYNEHYLGTDVLPEIMVHQVVDAGNPPKHKDPFLPYPGGDVIPLGDNKFQIRATFGADESVQGFPCDVWEVEFKANGSIEINRLVRAHKNESVIPAPGIYKKISIPDNFRDKPALTNVQVLSMAEVCRQMVALYGQHRLEFDGTITTEGESLVIIESTPFSLQQNSDESYAHFSSTKIKPVMTFSQQQDFERIPANEIVFAYIPNTYFQGNEKRGALTRLSIIARERGTILVVFATGNIATQHAVRALMDNDHIVIFVGDEEFAENEQVRMLVRGKELLWEREDPIVLPERMRGRGVERVGGKAVGLYKLNKYGFKTSPFFVVETSLFGRIAEELNITDLLTSLDTASVEDITGISRLLTEKISSFKINLEGLEEALTHIGGDRFAVRSSATCEDGKYSFAGIFKTILNVTPKDITAAIAEVLASSLSEDAIRATRILEMKPSQTKMAVIIQRMIDAKKAGTVFTKDHISNDENLLRIEATEGLGEGIMEGTSPDHQTIIVDKNKRQIRKQNIYKRSGSILSEEEIRRLVQDALEIETNFKEGPQDLEWVISQSGELFILQARPI